MEKVKVEGPRFLVQSGESESRFESETEAIAFMQLPPQCNISQQLFEYRLIIEPKWWRPAT